MKCSYSKFLSWFRLIVIAGFLPRSCHSYGYYGNSPKCAYFLTVVISAEADHVPKNLINEIPVKSVEECAKVCVQNSLSCNSFHFSRAHASEENALCSLMTNSTSILSFQHDQHDALPSMYNGQLRCLETKNAYCDRPWSFERIDGLAIMDSQFVLTSILQSDVDTCLANCLETPECHAVQMHTQTGSCRLLSINTNTVRDSEEYFKLDKEWSLYENNCHFVPMTAHSCQFLRQVRSGMVSVFDVMMHDVHSVDTCKHMCMQYEAATCRSYTFNSRSSLCYLSHWTMRGLGKLRRAKKLNSVLKTDEQFLEMADLEDCIHLELKCQLDNMLVRGQSMKMFSGQFRTRADPASPCSSPITQQYNFQTNIPYYACGTKHKGPATFTNTIFLKDGGTELITVRDKLVQLVCKIYTDDVPVTYNFDVFPNPNRQLSNDPLIISPDLPPKLDPKFKLEIYDAHLNPAKIVTNGERGFLEIQFNKDSDPQINLQVTDLVATDVQSQHTIILFDENGCPTNKKYAGVLKNVGGGKMRAPISFFGFEDSSTIYYRGLAKPCIGDCQTNCDEPNSIRKRRSMASLQEATRKNALFLTDERYRISSINSVQFFNNRSSIDVADFSHANSSSQAKTTLVPEDFISISEVKEFGIKLEKHSDDPNVVIEKFDKKPTVLCFTQDPNCLVTVLLAFLQALLLILFGFILYVYCRQSGSGSISRNYESIKNNIKELKETVKTKTIAIYATLHDVQAPKANDLESNNQTTKNEVEEGS